MKKSDNGQLESYRAEAQARWGKTEAYVEHVEKTKNYSKAHWNELSARMDEIFAEFAAHMKQDAGPDSARVQNLAEKLKGRITEHYYTCTNEILAGLGQMYVADERFRNYIDRHGEGTAEFVRKAIEIYCGK